MLDPSRWLKSAFRQVLRRRNHHLLFVPRQAPSGFDLERDLGLYLDSPSPLCLDIGANAGQTIELIQRVSPRARIHAFEPSSTQYRALAARQFGGPVFLHNLALGSRQETRTLLNYEKSDLTSFLPLSPHPANRYRDVALLTGEDVGIQTVDSFTMDKGIEFVDLLKSDTQGFDLEVLLGASGMLRRGAVSTILVELNFLPMYEGQSSALSIIDFLGQHGFGLVDLYEKIRQDDIIAWCTALFRRAGRTGN